jgi:hypothetical protein
VIDLLVDVRMKTPRAIINNPITAQAATAITSRKVEIRIAFTASLSDGSGRSTVVYSLLL